MTDLTKAYQPGLLEQIVPIAGSVSKDGVVTPPHYAIRHVKMPEPPKPSKKAIEREKSAVKDLFADVAPAAAEPDKKPDIKPKRATKKKEKTEASADKEPAIEPAKIGMDYAVPFASMAVPAFGVPAGITKTERRAINAECVTLLGNSPIPADKLPILRQYSGNGGCGDSLNEFYTDTGVAMAMWNALRTLGVSDGAEVLEPSCATGVFLETAPKGVHVVGVEMDPTSAAIGAALHPTHEVHNASLERFAVEDTRTFDAVVGNAPFGLRGSLLKDDKPNLKTAEAYFMDTSLDKAKPGGVVAMIVPTGVMDNRGTRALRERMLRKGEFLGALRMPNTAFEHSHTEVTTDILFFRKRPQDVASALMTVKQAALQLLGVWDEEYLAGEYFTGRGAANVLGTMKAGWRSEAGMGDDITVEGSMIGVPDAVAAFQPEAAGPVIGMAEIITALGGDSAAIERAKGAALKLPYDNASRGDTKTVDGVQYILEGSPLRWHRVDEFLQTKAVTDAQEVGALIEAAIAGNRPDDLAARVRAYVEEHGIPSKNYDLNIAAHSDKSIYALLGAVKADGTLSDLVEERKSAPVESSFDAAAQVLALEVGYFTPEMVAGRWAGGDTETVLDHLYASPEYALDPASGTWTSVDNYLSGELWPKLDAARAAAADEAAKAEDRARYERQAALLEETIAPKLLEDVEVHLNSAFLPLHVVAGFFNAQKRELEKENNEWAKKQPDMAITFDQSVYAIAGGVGDRGLLEKYLNRSGVRKDDIPQIDRWNAEFKDWLCASPFRDEVEDLYNRKFRGFRQREYSNAPMDIPGLNAEGLKDYTWGGVRWAIEAGKGIIAADVGLGKTVRALILARAAVTAGTARKPMIVVPKSVLANWMAEAERWFPGSNVMVIGETYTRGKDGELKGKEDSAADRNRKYHDIRQNDYDFILISQPAWNDLDVDPETKFNYSEGDFWTQRGDKLGAAGDKRINKIRESYKQHMASREFQSRTDALYFNDLGVDMIIGDEFHAFKNLYAARNRFGESPKFLGGQGLSNRALDMNFKSRWIRETNGGRNVYGLTATPTKNSPLEIYSLLSHIAPEAFDNIGVRNSEEFLDRFCEFKLENILTTKGTIEEALVTVGFKNLDELREIMRRYIDRKTAEEVGLVLPKRDDRLHMVDMTAEQESVYVTLREAAAKSAKKKDSKGDAHIFSVMDKMGKASMDLELYDPKYKGSVSPKYDEAATWIAAGAKDGGQVIFADNVAVHEKMVDALVAKGVPRNRIAIMNAKTAATSAQRQNIADKFNRRALDAVIGNTATMGEGQNLQKGTTDIHHMDLPWEPASVQQRNGRGLRQGNISESVRIHTYLAKGSFDGYRWQCLSAKRNWQDLLWNGGDKVENLAREGAISRDDMLVMLSANPEEARAKLDGDKVAAQKKFEAMKHGEAAAEFVHFQEMKRNYGSLKNKATPSAERLRVRMARARVNLEANSHFKAKHALDSKSPVVLDPTTGTAFEAGTAFSIDKLEGDVNGGGKFVVMGAHPYDGHIRVRRYGEAKVSPMIFTMDMLKHGVKPFEHDAAAENAEIAKQIAEHAKESLAAVTGPKDLHGTPSAVIEESYAAIQSQIKGLAKEYGGSWPPSYGAAGMIGPNGDAVAAESYDARGKLDDHDVMLPIPAHREKAFAAFLADERAKEYKMDYVPARRGKSEQRFASKYPGSYSNNEHNRWGHIGKEVFGEGFEKEARAHFDREQNEAARRATSLPEVINAVAPTVTVNYGKVHWNKRALAVLFAKAKKDGKLAEKLESQIPKRGGEGWGKDSPKWPPQMFVAQESGYSGRPATQVGAMPIGRALRTIAQANGYTDLAAAMAASHPHGAAALQDLMEMHHTDRHVQAGLRHVLDKNPELRSRPVSEFNGRHARLDDTTIGEYVEGLTDAEVRDAA